MKKIAILGGGESGVGTAILAQKQGYDVFVSDYGKIKPKYQEILEEYNIRWEQEQHTEEEILSADEIVKSPGIPATAPIIQKCKAAGKKINSEIGFALNFFKGEIIAITGSNGKTTTTILTHHILKEAGLNIGIAGNVGKSFARQVAEDNYDGYVLEMSSFQLDDTPDFHPHIALLTNLSPDHLNRYNNEVENYYESKMQIVKNQLKSDYFIYNSDDENIKKLINKKNIQAALIPFSMKEMKQEQVGAFLQEKTIVSRVGEEELRVDIDELPIKGKHNVQNSMAAGIISQLKRVRNKNIRESMKGFSGVPHRLEHVVTKDGVLFINDSKATNVNSTYYAFDAVKKPIIWIAGGEEEGNDYTSLLPIVREKVKAIVCLGLDNSKIIKAFEKTVDIYEARTMGEAVQFSKRLAERGDVVLLSPACKSFDLFKSYEDRGDQFKNEITKI